MIYIFTRKCVDKLCLFTKKYTEKIKCGNWKSFVFFLSVRSGYSLTNKIIKLTLVTQMKHWIQTNKTARWTCANNQTDGLAEKKNGNDSRMRRCVDGVAKTRPIKVLDNANLPCVLLENRKHHRSCDRINVIGRAVKVYYYLRRCLHLPSTLGNKCQYGRYRGQLQPVATQQIT